MNKEQSNSGAFAIVLAAGFMTLLDVSIVNVALPSITATLHASPTELQWVLAGYALMFGLSLVAAGRAGDIFGRRKLFLLGMAGFVAASVGAGAAPTATWLVILRLVQGLFAGVLNPQVVGLIQDMYKGAARARAFGMFGVVVGVSTAIGPALGGLLIELVGPEFGWRLVFLINLPIGMVVIPLAAKWLPAPPEKASQSKRDVLKEFDPVGVLLLAIVVVLVMWPFLESSSTDTSSTKTIAIFLVGAALVAGILRLWEGWWRRRGNEVLLEPDVIKNPPFALGTLTAFFYFAGFTSIFLLITLYLQQGNGWSALHAGVAVVPFSLISGFSSGMSGRLVMRFGRIVPVLGILGLMVGLLVMAGAAWWLPEKWAPHGVLASITFSGIGSGLVISPNQALTLEEVPRAHSGLAAALLQTFQRLGTAIGLSVVTNVYYRTLGPNPDLNDQAQALALGSITIVIILLFALASSIADALRRSGAAPQQDGLDQK